MNKFYVGDKVSRNVESIAVLRGLRGTVLATQLAGQILTVQYPVGDGYVYLMVDASHFRLWERELQVDQEVVVVVGNSRLHGRYVGQNYDNLLHEVRLDGGAILLVAREAIEHA